MINKFNLIKKLEVVLLTVLATANAFPYFLLTGYHRILYFITYICILIICMANFKELKKIKIGNLLRILLILYMIIIPYFFNNSVYSNRYLYLSGLLSYPIIYEKIEKSILKKVIYILIIVSCITAIQTLIGLKANSYAARMADEFAYLQYQGVGSYMFIYALSLAIIIIFSFIINTSINKKNIFLIFVIILFMITIIKSNFITSVILVIFGLTLAVLFKKMNIKKKIILICLIILTFILLYDVASYSLRFFISNFSSENSRLALVFTKSEESLIKLLVNEFISDRFPTLLTSIQAIKNYPILGLICNNSNTFGEHSTFLDTFALWGIPVSIFYIILIITPFFKGYRKNNYQYTMPIVLSFLLLSFFNNIEPTTIFVFSIIGLYTIDIN